MIEEQEHQQEQSVRSVNQAIEVANRGPTKTRKRIDGDPGDEPITKTMRRGPCPTCKENLDQGLRFPNERTSRRWYRGDLEPFEEEEIIEFNDSDSDDKTDEDDDDNDDSDDNYSPDINVFSMEMKVDPIYSTSSRELCEWDLEYWQEL